MAELTQEIIDNAPEGAQRYNAKSTYPYLKFDGTRYLFYVDSIESWVLHPNEKCGVWDWMESIELPIESADIKPPELTQEIIDDAPEGADRYSFELGKYLADIGGHIYYSDGVGWRAYKDQIGVEFIWSIATQLPDLIPLEKGVTNIKCEPLPNIDAKKGEKYDQDKPRYDLVPVRAEAELVDVLTFGASKYAPNQWRNVPDAKERYTAAAMRHIAAYRMGETHDIESGKHHLAHAMCCLAFIVELDLEKNQ